MSQSDVLPMNSLSLGGAQRVAEAAIASARSKDVAVCIAVCDPAGAAIVTIRMDGAPRLSAEVALNKAYSVAAFKGVPTENWWPMLADDPALVHGLTHTDRLIVFGGGVPVKIDGSLVGAIGVSGGSAQQDCDIAAAGATSVGGA